MSTNGKKVEPLLDILKRSLRERGWVEDNGTQGYRKIVNAWRHVDGDTAVSLNDALVKQLMREV